MTPPGAGTTYLLPVPPALEAQRPGGTWRRQYCELLSSCEDEFSIREGQLRRLDTKRPVEMMGACPKSCPHCSEVSPGNVVNSLHGSTNGDFVSLSRRSGRS